MTNMRKAGDMAAMKAAMDNADNVGRIAMVKAETKFVAGNKAKMDAAMHIAAYGAILLSLPADNGGNLNATPAAQLLNALPRGSRAKTLAAWFAAFSNIAPTYDKAAGMWTAKMIGPKSSHYKPEVDSEAAFRKPFWAVEEKAPKPREFLLSAGLCRLIEAAEREAKAHALDADSASILADLRVLRAKYVPAKAD